MIYFQSLTISIFRSVPWAGREFISRIVVRWPIPLVTLATGAIEIVRAALWQGQRQRLVVVARALLAVLTEPVVESAASTEQGMMRRSAIVAWTLIKITTVAWLGQRRLVIWVVQLLALVLVAMATADVVALKLRAMTYLHLNSNRLMFVAFAVELYKRELFRYNL